MNGQRQMGFNTGTGRVQRQLANWNAHALTTQIAQAQDTLAIRHHNGAHVLDGPIVQDGLDVALVLDRNVQAARSRHNLAPFLTCQANGRRVDDGHVLFNIRLKYLIEQYLVTIGQIHQELVLGQIRGLTIIVRFESFNLDLDIHHMRRQ